MEENPPGKCFYGLKTNCTEHPAQATSAIPKAKQNLEGLKNEQWLSFGIFLLFSSTVVENAGYWEIFYQEEIREVQRHPLGLLPQSIPTSLSPSRAGKGVGDLGAPRALGTGTDAVPGQGTCAQFQLCLQDS